jgi:GT2 family glycosyltransferase
MIKNVTAVVVNWNSGTQLQECLGSLQNVCPAIVVDNASTDGSCDGVDALANVTVIAANENLGFGKACNLGASRAQTEYLLFLNPDATVFPGTMEHVLLVMAEPAYSNVGICGVQLVDSAGAVSRSCARFPSAAIFAAEAIGLDKFIPRLGLLMSDWHHNSTQHVDHVIGAFFLVRTELFKSLHGFDERFFVYLEDLDFSYRAKQAGWKSLYLADVQAFHRGGGTSDQIKARRLFYVLRSRLLYANKHFGFWGALVTFLSTLFLEPVSRSVLALLRRSWSDLKETWQAYGMLWRWLPSWVFKGLTR